MLREMADILEQERAELKAAKATVQAQTLKIEKLEHRVARLLRVQFGRSSEKMDIAQLRLMFNDVETPEPANDDAAAVLPMKSARGTGGRVPLPAHLPRHLVEHPPGACSAGCSGPAVKIDEAVTEVLDYVPARFRVIRHVRQFGKQRKLGLVVDEFVQLHQFWNEFNKLALRHGNRERRNEQRFRLGYFLRHRHGVGRHRRKRHGQRFGH